MFEVYTGDDKQSVTQFELRTDAILIACQKHAKLGIHHGVRFASKVIFNTNFNDPEFVHVSG